MAATHELRVGISANPPWTVATGTQPSGIEPDLVNRFAAQSGAQVRWVRGSETVLVGALEDHKLDLVIGGFNKETQWSSKAGVSQPFARDSNGDQRVFLAAPGENRFILSLDTFLTHEMRRSEGRA